MALVRELTLILEEKCRQDWPVLYPGAALIHKDYFPVYVVGGCMGILQRWVSSGMKEAPQEMALLLESTTNATMGAAG